MAHGAFSVILPSFDMTSSHHGAMALVSSTLGTDSPLEPEQISPLAADDALRLLALSKAFVARVDAEGHLVATTPAASELFGYPVEYLAQVRLADLVLPQHTDELSSLLYRALKTGGRESAILQFARDNAECFWLHLVAQRQGYDGSSLEVFGYDVSSWMATEQGLRDAARRDPLTGTGNRILLREWISQAIGSNQAMGQPFAVALLDLDGFKRINDSLGHDAGDELLCAVSKRLQALMRAGDTVARIGGDEFVLLIRDVKTNADAKRIGSRIVTSLQHPFVIAGRQLHVTTSLGMALYPGDGVDESQLLKRADLAMYQAKERGKNQYSLYSQDLEQAEAEAFALELNMFEGITNGEFELHYQPIVDARTREVRAVEALMRWNRPSGQVPPTAFIPLAEDNGVINILGSWALRTACMQLAKWDAADTRLAYVTVNVSPIQFHYPTFASTVKSAVIDSNIAPHRLVLEITEGALMKYPDQALAVLSELRDFGVRFAIDDFGTGYSNLAHLRRFPLSALKIDRSFVSDMPNSTHDRAIVSAVLSLAKELGLSVVAEGVELESQRELLVERGCEYTQGWLFAKALSPSQFEEALASKQLALSSDIDISYFSQTTNAERIGL
jgi:diguanylate cyclase (GGDEF)-like protein